MRWAQVKRKLFSSIEKGEYTEVISLIEEYPKALRASRHTGETPMHVAARCNHVELLQYFIENGYIVDCNFVGLEDDSPITPLQHAAAGGALEAAEWLIENGADVDGGGIPGEVTPPLIWAVQKGHLGLVKLLIEKGASLDASYELGEGKDTMVINAVKMAQMKGHSEILEYLYSQGATDPIDTYKEERELPEEVFLLRHIEQQIGKVQDTVSEIIPASEASIQVHIIPPTVERQDVTLVTTGMSAQSMAEYQIGDELQFAELMFALPPTWPISKDEMTQDQYRWPLDWIRQIAHLPFLYEGWIDEGIIIPNGEPPVTFSDKVMFSSLLVLRPEDRALSHCKPGYKEINFYYLIPLYEEERQLAMNKGEAYLIEKLRSQIPSLHIMDPNRVNVGK
ncbi:suppressor of fused domain protein [Priestia endophytica]|uniref:suppressor of fused domain protein n=1 Tax=Priestia endophytica TaxID=135735 RepID=UPI003D2BEE79